MTERDALIFEYSHLRQLPREKEALLALRKISSLVKPIMRARGWKVGTLAEFYPDQKNLLGINVNKGHKICLRLRYPGDQNQFLPHEQVVDTMLHELSHNVHGPHDEKFHALWDQLRKEHEALQMKGYTGEGFLSDGRKLGGARVPRDEARRIARAAAEKRRTLHSGSGQRLGGAPVRAGTDIRTVIVNAIERRGTVLKGCGSDMKNLNDKEIIDLADEATTSGTKTKASEDEANDRAIAQALWELVQEDEMSEYGSSYVPPTPNNPAGSSGGKANSEKPRDATASSDTKGQSSRTREPPRHVSRLVTAASSNERKPAAPKPRPQTAERKTAPVAESDSPGPTLPSGWTCQICTLHNPITFLCCDACGVERAEEITRKVAEADRKRKAPIQSTVVQSKTWTCKRCTTVMENQWWTCATCGVMKDNS